MPPSVHCPAMVSKRVTKQSEDSAEITEEGVVTAMKQRSCVHFDKRFNLDKLLKNMKYCQQIKCLECKEGVHVKNASISKVNNGKNGFPSSSKKVIWLCLECGYSVCGEPAEPQSHVVQHIKLTRHFLVIQCENPKLRWCVPCNSLLSFEKEENGEKKDLLLEVVKLIKERYPNTFSASVETHESYSKSDSVTGEIKLQGSVSSGIEARDGYYALRGLVNLGNTCFFNSVLQNLLSLDQLRDHFLKEDLSAGGGLLFSSLKRLFDKTKSEASFFNSVINPIDFFSYLCSQAPQFRGYQQHDSHELLRCLLDCLSVEESSLREKKLGVSDSNDSSRHREPTLVDSVFGGEISSTVSCLECGHSSKVYEPFLDLSLPVPSKKPHPRRNQTIYQKKNVNIPPNKVLENGVISKDSETVSAKPELDHKNTVSILETPSNMAHEDAVSGISADINEAQVCGYPDLEKSSLSENMWDDEELHLMVADSQVLCMPYKDDISYDDKTVAQGKGDASSSYVSGHHEQTVDYVDFSSFFDEPDVSCDDKTVRECEGEASSSFVSDNHEQNIDYVDFSSFFDEPEVSEGPVFGPLSKAEVSEAGLMAVSSNDKTVKATSEGEASSLFVFGNHEQNREYADFSNFFNGPEIFKGPPSKDGLMSVIWNYDSEVLDDSDSPVSLDRCLAQLTMPEILAEDNAWHCENCSKNLKLQRLREKRKTKEGLGNGWVNENGDTLSSDLENGYKVAPVTELPNYKEEKNAIDDDGVLGDSDTKQPSTATKTPILGGETINSQQVNDNESEKREDEAEDSEEVIVKTEATKRVLVNKAPSVLTIHLKRFSQDARGRLNKLSGHVNFKEFLDLSQYMDTRWSEEDQPVYRLVGLVEHKGTMRGGHYIAYIKGHKERSNSDIKEPNSSIWHYASDYYVRQASFEEVLHSEAYMLFYQRI